MRKLLSLLLFFLLCNLSLYGQINQYGYPIVTNYAPDEYNAGEQNWSVVQDKRGIMYFGNTNGVLEYDGSQWRQIPVSNNSLVRSLAVDNDGTVFVGAVNEFGYLSPDKKGKLHYVSLSSTLDTALQHFNNVWKTHAIDGKVYFCPQSQIFEYDYNKITVHNIGQNDFYSFYIDSTLYIGNYTEGLRKFEHDSIKNIENGEILLRKNIFALLPYTSEQYLLGTVINGLYKYNFKQDTILDFSSPQAQQTNTFLKKNQLYDGIALTENRFAFATLRKGAIVIDENARTKLRINKKTGLQDKIVTFLYTNRRYEDCSNILWLALNNGISKAEYFSPFYYFGEEAGILSTVSDVIRHENRLYIATDLGVLYQTADIDGTAHFTQVENSEKQTWTFLSVQVPNSEGENNKILLAGTSSGVFEIRGTTAYPIIDNYYCFDLHQSKINPDMLYIGWQKGLAVFRYDNGKWIEYNRDHGIKEEIRKIAEDDKGNIWLTTLYNGIIKLTKQENDIVLKYYDKNSGLPGMEDNQVYFINNKLITTTKNGFYFYDEVNDRFNPYQPFNKLLSDKAIGIFRISEDHQGNVWLNARDNKYEWIECFKKEGDSYLSETLSFKRLYNLPVNSIQAFYHEKNGMTWIGTSKGLYSYNGKEKSSYNQEFNTLIRKVTVGEDSILFSGTNYSMTNDSIVKISLKQPNELIPVLPYSCNNLIFNYSATCFIEEKATEYSYFLEGFSDSWSKWNDKTEKEFTNIPEGEYILRVKARNIYGIESNEATYRFEILPPWYRTIWAYIGYVILALIVMYAVVKLNARRLEHEKMVLEGIVAERTAEVVKQKEEIEEKANQLKIANVEINEQKEEIQAQADHLKEVNEVITNQNTEITKQKEELEHKNREITDSINYAQRIQKAVMPPKEFVNQYLPENFILLRPRDIVSGDFYWMTRKKGKNDTGDTIIICAADCTGHGVPGAFMSMLGVSFLNEIVNKFDISQANLILNELRTSVKKSLRQTGKSGEAKDGMDIALCVINVETMTMQYAGAYNPLLLIRNNEVLKWKADKMPIGIYIREKESFTNHEIELQHGDAFYIFSDGYIDQFGGEKGGKFMIKNFKEMLLDIHHKPMQEQKQILNKRIEEWMGSNYNQIDDMLVIGVKIP